MKKKAYPPKWINKVLTQFCDPYLFEGISGDLLETFEQNVESKGIIKAKAIYIFQSIGFLRTTFKRKPQTLSNMRSIWLNYFITSFRSLKKNKSFFAINLIGLVIAIVCSLFAIIFINDELQFDKEQTGSKNIHRLYKRHINPNENVDHLTYETSGMMGPTMMEEYPEIESYTRVRSVSDKVIISYKQKNISTEKLYFVDSTFFSFFNFSITSGNPTTCLKAPSSIVLSESLAKAIFGDVNPIGQTVIGINDLNYTVTGIFKDVPRQSSLQFDALISWSTTVPNVGPLSYNWMNNWLAQGIFTFVELSNNSDPKSVESKLPKMMNHHFKERADQYFLKLIPMKEIYLYSDNIRSNRGLKSGSITFVYTLGLSALLIFTIASVNYINISLSRAVQAKTEVGIRKVMGSSRRQLMGRFVSETFISTVIASGISILIFLVILPEVNQLSGKNIPASALLQPVSVIAILSFIFGSCLIIGLYPAVILSAPPVSSILKSSNGQVGSAGWFRKSLIALQYAISIFLISCTIFVSKQSRFLANKPLGFDKDQVLVIDLDNEVGQKADILESELLSHPNILSVSTCRSAIGAGSWSTTIIPEGFNDELGTRIYGVDQEFFETYGIEATAGRTFLKGSIADSNNFIVNQAFVDHTGWENPIGKHFSSALGQPSFPIIGVVNDFHIHSLASTEIEPMLIYLSTNEPRNTSIKIGKGDLVNTIDHIETTWNNLAGRTPLNFYFVDEWFNKQYLKEKRLLEASNIYSIISILLCALGLYGITSLLLQQRSKEISIRKVLGASINSIVSMVNKQFVIITTISFCIATPISYFIISKWIGKFAYRVMIDATPFLIAGVSTLVLSLLIVTGLSIRTANINPSKNLSSE